MAVQGWGDGLGDHKGKYLLDASQVCMHGEFTYVRPFSRMYFECFLTTFFLVGKHFSRVWPWVVVSFD